ncbi:hypothetical protein [Clostridium sp.]|jgi:hypothetical protein|uniref:hypothetical protein n=1 Tax=Clostridium sp. TaxID=1506 RepID=UPI003EF06A96
MINKNKLKKIASHFKSKKMATQLFGNYILFLVILVGIFMLAIGALLLYISINNKDSPTVNTTADYIISKDYKDINAQNVIKYKGFVEVLDINLVIIMEEGSKHEVGFKYSLQYFHDMITNNLNDDYFYSSKYGTNRDFILITAIPNNIYNTYSWGLQHIELLREVSKAKKTESLF